MIRTWANLLTAIRCSLAGGDYRASCGVAGASSDGGGKQPYWPDTLWRRYGKTAVRKAGIPKRVGFHTFRHYLHHLANSEQRGREGCAGTSSRCQQSDYSRLVPAGGHAGKEARTKQSSKVVKMVLDAGEALA